MDRLEEFNSSRIALSTQLEKLMRENSDLQLEWMVNETNINGLIEDFSYIAMKENPREKEWIQRFLDEFTPVYEKLSLYSDYYESRNATMQKDAYNTEELNVLYKDYVISGEELLMLKRDRATIIQSLDPLDLEKKNISINKLLYLAKNTPSTWEVYDLLKDKMLNNQGLFSITSTETTNELAEYFHKTEELLGKTILQSETEKDEQVVLELTDMVVLFYTDLKALIDAMKGRRMKLR